MLSVVGISQSVPLQLRSFLSCLFFTTYLTMKAVCVALALLSLVSVGYGLSCYTCTSVLGGDCGDPFSSSTKTICPNSISSCSKSKTSVAGVETVTRACDSGSNGCNTAELFGVKSTTCYCTGDNCNSATGVTASVVAMVLSAALPMVLLK